MDEVREQLAMYRKRAQEIRESKKNGPPE